MSFSSFKTSRRGISMPIVVGLVLLLIIASVAVNRQVIRTLRSVHQIEASSRAYFAAEAGIEEALYELSAHFSGYDTAALGDPCKTPPEGDPNYQTSFNAGDVCWKNTWTIQSHDLSTDCAEDAQLCGEIGPARKLVLSLFNDEGGRLAADIETVAVSTFEITFNVSVSSDRLIIDNDDDAWVTTKDDGINEDGGGNREDDLGLCPRPGGGAGNSRDADCDGIEDEDSEEDPVIYWKITDGAGKTLVPKEGCLNETDAELPQDGSEICEKSFQPGDAGSLRLILNQEATGIREDGVTEERIREFLDDYTPSSSEQLQMEFLVVAPLLQVDAAFRRKIPIPSLEYDVEYSANKTMPDSYFQLQSDGWYGEFKQSITTTLTPKSSVPLGDFTLIQQQ